MDDRARGRARGMIRTTTAGSQQPSNMRPGPTAADEPQAAPGPAGEANFAGGRAFRRGGKSITTVREGESAGEPAARGDGPYVIGARRNYDSALFTSATKPNHIRSKQGETGRAVQLATNFFRLKCSKNWRLCQYAVSYEPVIDNIKVRKAMLYGHKDVIGEVFIFDGTVLFSTKKLPDKVTVLKANRRNDENTEITITVTLTNELPVDSNISLQLYNIIFRWLMTKIGLTQVGRNYYDPKAKTHIPCGRTSFEMWPGFQTSILQYEKDVMLCSQVSHKLMRTNTVLDALYELVKTSKQRGRSYKEEIARFLNGQVVLTRYNNKTYKIDGIEWEVRVNHTFKKADGSEISYLEYYENQYQIKITDSKQPLLVSTPKKTDVRRQLPVIHLVPELCTLTGLTDEHRADFNVMKTLAKHTKQGPPGCASAITTFIQRISNNPEAKKLMDDWGLSFEQNLVEVRARELGPEKICVGGGEAPLADDGSWTLRSKRMLSCVNLEKWVLVRSDRDERIAEETKKTLLKVSGPMGFNVRPPQMKRTNGSLNSFHDCIKEAVREIKDLQMIFVILPSNAKEKYDSLKTLCCVEFGIPSQFAVARTLGNQKRLMSVCTKIAIQMNVKLGGEAWTVPVPLNNVMIIGIDTYHDSSRRGHSVGGFVSSFNKALTKWHSQPIFQGINQEFLNALEPCISGAIKNYQKHNGGMVPTQIFIYRDGVGDGQIDFVKNHEVPQIKNALMAFSNGNAPIKLNVIIVTKRINGRFFKKSQRGLTNPAPGTIIDDIVTKKDRYDFYVVSQHCREGTVTPTNFNVIHDESAMKADHMQRLSYKLCHLYFNWAGTVRVPAPCLYAHKLAFLIGQSVHRGASVKLADKLYYL